MTGGQVSLRRLGGEDDPEPLPAGSVCRVWPEADPEPLSAQTRADARTPSPFVAQCRPIGAARLPLRLRSSAKTMPATAVNAMVASTLMPTRRRTDPTRSWIDVLARARSMAGSTCHSPKRTDDTTVAQSAP